MSDDVCHFLELVVAEASVGKAQAKGAVGVNALKGSDEVAVGITVAGGRVETIETAGVVGVDVGAYGRVCFVVREVGNVSLGKRAE